MINTKTKGQLDIKIRWTLLYPHQMQNNLSNLKKLYCSSRAALVYIQRELIIGTIFASELYFIRGIRYLRSLKLGTSRAVQRTFSYYLLDVWNLCRCILVIEQHFSVSFKIISLLSIWVENTKTFVSHERMNFEWCMRKCPED